MKANEIRNKPVEELREELDAQLEKQFKLRMKKATGQLEQSHSLGAVRKDIARIKTILNEKAVN